MFRTGERSAEPLVAGGPGWLSGLVSALVGGVCVVGCPAYIRAAADRAGVPVRQVCQELAQRTGPRLT